ncbi:MAG: sulfur carrier protein ThiS [Acidobacteriia bacterium]|nr:sulfur carrier protein ThiS [Terriglobia bacterium]
MINVILNGEKIQMPENLSLRDCVAHLGLPAESIAIEYNLEIIKRKDWGSREVKEGDTIEIVHFIGGG